MSRRATAAALSLFAAALVAYYFFTTPGLFGSKAQGDGMFSFHYLPSLVVYRSLDMRHALPEDLDAMDTGARGHKLNRAPIGPALAMLPIYCLVEGAKLAGVSVLRALGRSPQGLGPPPFVPHTGQMLYTGLVTLAAGLCGMLLTYALLRRYVSRGAALIGAVAAVGLTPQLWYLTIQPHYQHGLAFAAGMLLLWRWDLQRGRRDLRRFFALGVLGGVAMLMRVQEVVFLLAPIGELAWAVAQRRRSGESIKKLCGCAALLGLGAGLGFLPQLFVWGRYFGWFVRPKNIERLRPLAPALTEVLWSMRAGLFPWTPVAYLGIFGLGLGLVRGASRAAAGQEPEGEPNPRRLQGLLAAALAVLLSDVYLVAASWVWYGGFSFGARRLSDCAGILGLGVAVLWTQVAARRRRRLGQAALLLLLLLLGASNFALVELVRQRRIPDSGAAAQPAYRLAQQAGGPAWLVRLLRHGYPFAQPAGLGFALYHRAPLTAWEGVVGNYALEREAHDFSVSGATWDFRRPEAELFVLEGLLPAPWDATGRPVGPRVRLLLQPFARTEIAAALFAELPPDGVRVKWNGVTLPTQADRSAVRFTIPAAQVTAHAVGELTLVLSGPARLRQLRLSGPLP